VEFEVSDLVSFGVWGLGFVCERGTDRQRDRDRETESLTTSSRTSGRKALCYLLFARNVLFLAPVNLGFRHGW
jgi:hypothetical protein